MVISDIIGGLGNQMFMYAAARRVSLMQGVKLKLNTTHFQSSYGWRRYGLNNLSIVEDIAGIEDLTTVLYQGHIYSEPGPFSFDPKLDRVAVPVYMRGYFQSFRYLEGVEDSIRSEFQVRTPPAGQNAQLLEMIRGSNSVAVHIRRGDYVTDPGVARMHGALPLDYYLWALRLIVHRAGAATLFVFSDDIYWAQANLATGLPTVFVGHNGPDQDYEDLRLMSACKHFVIANSSFSWWAAWLGTHEGKIVCAPARWMASNPDTSDLIPESWTRIAL